MITVEAHQGLLGAWYFWILKDDEILYESKSIYASYSAAYSAGQAWLDKNI